MRGKQHPHPGGPHHHLLQSALPLGNAKAAIQLAARSIAPHSVKFGRKHGCQFGALKAKEVVHIPPRLGIIRIPMDAGRREICRTRYDHLAIDH